MAGYGGAYAMGAGCVAEPSTEGIGVGDLACGRLPTPKTIVGRTLAVDTATFQPAAHVLFFVYMSIANHGTTDRVASDLNERLWPALRTGLWLITCQMVVWTSALVLVGMSWIFRYSRRISS